jgi:hypothetical protein
MEVVVTIEALFPEMKGGRSYQQGRGRGSSARVAFANAGRDLFKQPGLKRQRYTGFTATVTVAKIKEQAEEKETNGYRD